MNLPNKKSPPLTVVTADAPAPTANQPPRPLGHHGLKLWASICAEYQIEDPGGRELLCLACESLDRASSLREAIARDGEMIRSKSGMRENPALKVELACRAFIVRTLVRLGLNIADPPLREPGRPPHGGLGVRFDDA
jgi:hypothetical protein